MNIDRTSVIAIAICALLYIGYEQYLNHKYPDRFEVVSKPEEAVEEVSSSSQAKKGQPLAQRAPSKPNSVLHATSPAHATKTVTELPSESLTLETETTTYILDQRTGGFRKILLKRYQNDSQNAPLNIVEQPLAVQGALPGRETYTPLLFEAAPTSDAKGIEFSFEQDGWKIAHEIRPDDTDYGAEITFSWTNLESHSRELTTQVLLGERVFFPKSEGSLIPGIVTMRPQLLEGTTENTSRHPVESFCNDGKALTSNGFADVSFIGYDDHYFMKVFLPKHKRSTYDFSVSKATKASCDVQIALRTEEGLVKPGETATLHYTAWLGPKQTEELEAYSPKLGETLDLGFFSTISRGVLVALKFIFSLVHNWGVAIIIFTILLKILFYPITKQASVSANKMKKLQPEMNRIREKYKDDPQRQQQETMRFMSENKMNPLKGCIPPLLQIPVFVALYGVLSVAIELRHAPFLAWITDLSAKDPFYVIPVLCGIVMVIHQKIMPMTGMDKTQEKIMMMLPIMFTVISLNFPAGVVLYMLTNSVVSIIQQQWINKKLQ